MPPAGSDPDQPSLFPADADTGAGTAVAALPTAEYAHPAAALASVTATPALSPPPPLTPSAASILPPPLPAAAAARPDAVRADGEPTPGQDDEHEGGDSPVSLTPAASPTPPTPPTPRYIPIARRGPLFDAGWLFLIAGVVILAFTVIIPAVHDLDDAKFYRERMELAEKHRQERLQRYHEYLAALNRGDEDLIRSLAAVQLNKAPVDTELLPGSGLQGDLAHRTASPFASLEPPPLVLPEKPVRQLSTLERWATDDRSRLWLLAAGALLILVGLLPASRRISGPFPNP